MKDIILMFLSIGLGLLGYAVYKISSDLDVMMNCLRKQSLLNDHQQALNANQLSINQDCLTQFKTIRECQHLLSQRIEYMGKDC
jgi:hypothetical protein